MAEKKGSVANRISLLLLIVLALLCLLDICSGLFLKNVTNLLKVVIYCVIFLLPVFMYIRLTKYKKANMLRIRHVKVKYLPFIIFFALSVSIICAFINVLFAAIFSGMLDLHIPTSTVEFYSESPLVICITAVIMPALCEELLLRGIALSEYEKYGLPLAVILTSIIFALFHGSLFTLPSLFVAGACYAILTCIFDSIWPAFLCHCINNALAVYINYNADYIKYLSGDIIFIVIMCIIVFAVLCIALRLSEKIVDDFGGKNRLKTNRKKLVYGEPLGSLYIWIFFAVSIFNIVRNLI